MEIKIPEKGIFKRIPKEIKSSLQLEDLLSDCFQSSPEMNIFARFSAANGYFIWMLPGGGWTQLSKSPSDGVKNQVETLLESRKDEVRAFLKKRSDIGLSPDMIDNVLSVPSDDFVYFRTDMSGNTEIKLVAWDYQLPSTQIVGKSEFRTHKSAPKQSVLLKFIEAGNPVPDYPILIKSLGGHFTEKRTDKSGTFDMPNLLIGSTIDVLSKDRSKDFSFTVKEGESERVYDLTEKVTLVIVVRKDGKPYVQTPVRVLFNGGETVLQTDNDGQCEMAVPYMPGAEVIVESSGESKTGKIDYPVTRINLEIHSPMAEILIYSTDDGNPSVGDVIMINISGYDSFTRTTDRDGCISEKVLYRPDAEISVSRSGEVQREFMQMSNVFRFDRVSPIPVPEPQPECYNVFLRCNKKPFQGGYTASIYQNGGRIILHPDSEGKCTVEKSLLESGKIATTIFNDGQKELGRIDVVFQKDEDDYELNLNLKKRIYPWDIISQILAGILAFLLCTFFMLLLIGFLTV